ncbi:MAG: PHP domain-containing protein [Thermodesulfobacteriota bacterium]
MPQPPSPGGIDLHTHSSCSDGSHSPRELVHLARENGLTAIALTDHDTVGGIDEAQAAGRETGVEVVSGIEVSVFQGDQPLHLLGYFLDHRHREILACLAEAQEIRHRRNRKMLQKINQLGIPIDEDELRALSGGQIGRPHFAALLVRKGAVATREQAFERFLKRNRAAYVAKDPYDARIAIAAIIASGGIAVLAHPGVMYPELKDLPALLRALKNHGLGGIEVHYPSHSPTTCRRLLRLAKDFDLAVTGGSDFHGSDRHGPLFCGTGGNAAVPYQILEELKRRLPGPAAPANG